MCTWYEEKNVGWRSFEPCDKVNEKLPKDREATVEEMEDASNEVHGVHVPDPTLGWDDY